GEERRLVVADGDEAAVDGGVLDRTVGEEHPRVALGEGAEERRVLGQEGDLAVEGARDDHGGLAGEEHLLRRHDLDRHRCFCHLSSLSARRTEGAAEAQRRPVPSISISQLSWSDLALARTCSTPPTLRNACSGTSSSSPFRIASKLSTVSSTGTNSPSMPVNTLATKNGWLRKRWILRARFTVRRSSSDSSSSPRMAMMSCSSL